MGLFLLFFVLGFLFLFFAVAISKKKWYFLIAGYNTSSDCEREKINIEGLAKHISIMCYIISAIFFIGGICSFIFKISIIPFMILLLLVISYYVWYLQRFDKNDIKKTDVKVVILVSLLTIIPVIFALSIGGRESKVVISENYIEISGLYGEKINKEDIKNVELINDMPKIIKKINGYDTIGEDRKGEFKLENQEFSMIYIEREKGITIKIKLLDENFYINYEDIDKTEECFNNIVKWKEN
ncbi:DUF3784 domain-containing protein [Clostridium sp.]|uniref:DUF3784 domain-containing protein n=1 Tax=Clostridium sp. TaxID=1506 RepID=UPI003F3AF718